MTNSSVCLIDTNLQKMHNMHGTEALIKLRLPSHPARVLRATIPNRRKNQMKTTTGMKKIAIRRTGDIRMTTSALCTDSCYCAFV